jgi:hypothetical protein
MIELPRGIWRWMANSAKDLALTTVALEKIARETAEIRKVL